MIKICEICGAEYEPYPARQRYQRTCGPACSAKWQQHKSREYQREHPRNGIDQRAKYERKLERSDAYPVCRICGDKVRHREPGDKQYKPMHEACVLRDCLADLSQGVTLNKLKQQRLYSRGYTIADLREMLREEDGEHDKNAN